MCFIANEEEKIFMFSVQVRRWLGASSLIGALLLSACGADATPTTVAPTATSATTDPSGGAATATGAPAAPTPTPVQVGDPNAEPA